MNGLQNILQSISDVEQKYLPKYLQALEIHQTLQLEDNSSLCQHITNLLNKPNTRHEGIQLLIVLLNQCPLESIEEKGNSWSNLLMKAFFPKSSGQLVGLAFNALRILVQRSKGTNEFVKNLCGTIFGKIFDVLQTITREAYLPAVKCIEICLRMYPGYCSPHKSSIEKFLLGLIDETDENVVLWTGKCLLLQQLVPGGAGTQGLSQKSLWQQYYFKLLGSLHEIVNVMFAHYSEIYDETLETERLGVNELELSNQPLLRAGQLYCRFSNLLQFLIICIKDPLPISKTFMPKRTFNLISRILSVNCTLLEKNPVLDNLAIGAFLPMLHEKVLHLMDDVILTLRGNSLMYSNLILNFLRATLKWTSSGINGTSNKPYVNLRVKAYKSINLWCNQMKYGNIVETIAEDFIEEILYDVTPYRDDFKMKTVNADRNTSSKKAKRKLQKTQNEQSHLARTHSKVQGGQFSKDGHLLDGNKELCYSAMNCLISILTYSSQFLRPVIIKEIQEKLLLICLTLHECSSGQGIDTYESALCRKSIYTALHTLAVSPHYLCFSAVQLIVPILSNAQNLDKNPEVRELCGNLLQNLEKIIHPQKECLRFPVSLNDINNAIEQGKRKNMPHEESLNNNSTLRSEDEEELNDEVTVTQLNNTDKVEIIGNHDNLRNSNNLEITKENSDKISTDPIEIHNLEEDSVDDVNNAGDVIIIENRYLYLGKKDDDVVFVEQSNKDHESIIEDKIVPSTDKNVFSKSTELEENTADNIEEINTVDLDDVPEKEYSEKLQENDGEPVKKRLRTNSKTTLLTENNEIDLTEDLELNFVDEVNTE